MSRMPSEYHLQRNAEKRQLVCTFAERGEGLCPQRPSLHVRTFVIAHIASATGPETPFVRHHRVVPGRQAGGERGRGRCAASGCQHRVRIHVKPNLSPLRSSSAHLRTASTLGGSVVPGQGPPVELKCVRSKTAGSPRQDGGVGARRRRREQLQTPRALAQAVRASDTAVWKAGAAYLVQAEVHDRARDRQSSEFRPRTTSRHRARLSGEQFAIRRIAA